MTKNRMTKKIALVAGTAAVAVAANAFGFDIGSIVAARRAVAA